MINRYSHASPFLICALLGAGVPGAALPAGAEPGYTPIAPTMSDPRVAAEFLKTTAASTFYRGDAPPGGER
jgi:hypothetical protein